MARLNSVIAIFVVFFCLSPTNFRKCFMATQRQMNIWIATVQNENYFISLFGNSFFFLKEKKTKRKNMKSVWNWLTTYMEIVQFLLFFYFFSHKTMANVIFFFYICIRSVLLFLFTRWCSSHATMKVIEVKSSGRYHFEAVHGVKRHTCFNFFLFLFYFNFFVISPSINLFRWFGCLIWMEISTLCCDKFYGLAKRKKKPKDKRWWPRSIDNVYVWVCVQFSIRFRFLFAAK